MSRLRNKFAVLLCAILSVSCGFIDLRGIKIEIEPDKKDFVLKDQLTPVIVKFGAEMMKKDTENTLQITSDSGAVSGDKFWKKNNLYFVPVNGWTAGIRYTISLNGLIRAADGREERVEYFNTFYALNKNDPPQLKTHVPSAGESVGTNDAALVFHFSRSMDKLSVESAFTLEGVSNKSFNWSDEDKIFTVTADKLLSPWSLYQWNIKNSAKSADGVQLPKIYSGFFTTDSERTLPSVTRIYPALNADGLWYPTGLDISSGLGLDHGIAVEFSRQMGESALRSMRFEPSLSGRTEYLSEKSVIYIFSKAPDPETEYTLIISGDTKDKEGLKLG